MLIATHHLPGMILTDHEFVVPLAHSYPDDQNITVFAREVVDIRIAEADLPWLVYFQGGPGFPSPRPLSKSGWLKRALQEYRVLLLDQRGTGRSTPVTFQTLARFSTPQKQADYLKHFRADSIVQDAEIIRKALVGNQERWTVLGQSFGGFCLTHYLSVAPAGLQEVLITGGLPPLERPVDDVYRATYRRVIDKNRRYYDRYPGDIDLAQEIVEYLNGHDVRLPGGDCLSPRRFQQLGLAFGASQGFEQVHYLLESAFVQGALGRELSFTFLRDFEQSFGFETNPIFAVLHEAIYCQKAASNWSAERMRAEYQEFEASSTQPVFFTGEMIYPWMFDEYRYLQPLKEAAKILADYDGWPCLYDPSILRANTVPCAAAVYYNDMYVERLFSEATAQKIQGIKLWVTSEYEHNGLRTDGETILKRLLGMVRGEI